MRHEELMAALSDEVKTLVNQPPTQEDFDQTQNAFQQADANQDNLLHLEEYLVFANLVLDNFDKKYKEKPAHTDDDHKDMYNALNSFNPDREGIDLYDIDKMK